MGLQNQRATSDWVPVSGKNGSPVAARANSVGLPLGMIGLRWQMILPENSLNGLMRNSSHSLVAQFGGDSQSSPTTKCPQQDNER